MLQADTLGDAADIDLAVQAARKRQEELSRQSELARQRAIAAAKTRSEAERAQQQHDVARLRGRLRRDTLFHQVRSCRRRWRIRPRKLRICAGAPLLFPTVRLGVTGCVVSFAMLLTYEWAHHLIHSAYRPKGRYYRYISRAHRLHHFRNEHYWYGVTIHLGDHVLRTFPAKDDGPVSATAFTLGIEQPAG